MSSRIKSQSIGSMDSANSPRPVPDAGGTSDGDDGVIRAVTSLSAETTTLAGGKKTAGSIKQPKLTLQAFQPSNSIVSMQSEHSNNNEPPCTPPAPALPITTSTIDMIARDTLSLSEFEDKTILVVIVRYTILKIVSSLSTFITILLVIVLVAIVRFGGQNSVNETEFFLPFLSVDICINATCIFFTFYSFGFSFVSYNLLCSKFEVRLISCFENRFKRDYYDDLVIEAKQAVDEELQNVNQSAVELVRTKTLKRTLTPSSKSQAALISVLI